MDLELLAKLMREKALLEEAGDLAPTTAINAVEIAIAKRNKEAKLEELKKLYFNAGRWVAGAQDWTARKAFEKVGNFENR